MGPGVRGPAHGTPPRMGRQRDQFLPHGTGRAHRHNDAGTILPGHPISTGYVPVGPPRVPAVVQRQDRRRITWRLDATVTRTAPRRQRSAGLGPETYGKTVSGPAPVFVSLLSTKQTGIAQLVMARGLLYTLARRSQHGTGRNGAWTKLCNVDQAKTRHAPAIFGRGGNPFNRAQGSQTHQHYHDRPPTVRTTTTFGQRRSCTGAAAFETDGQGFVSNGFLRPRRRERVGRDF